MGRILTVYHRILLDNREKQDELLRDFVRALAADLDRLHAHRRT
ncbi:hypothetical protein [Bacteroides mediterraneensis]|nr:hypothetical protein [Bacteroides mediterraneensis]